jgi:succinate dehydrogenase / fumarate reductase cytochrome b subunit
MAWIVRFLRSSLGAKYVMAITGIGLYLFLVGHVAGNLLLYVGQDAMNAYALGLRNLPFGLLWVARIGLVVLFGSHIFSAAYLTLGNRAARPIPYQQKQYKKASFASRTMPMSGAIVFLFLMYHLSHFTWRVVSYSGDRVDSLGRDDVYTMVVTSFQQPLIALFYLAAMLVLGIHLHHGLSSLFQTLGLNNSRYNHIFRNIFPLLGWVVVLAGASIPLSVLVGFIR